MAFNQPHNVSSKLLRFRGGYVSVSKSTASSVQTVKVNATGRRDIESGCVTRRRLADHQVPCSRAKFWAGQPRSARPSGIAVFASSVTGNCRCSISKSIYSSRRFAFASVRPSVKTACFRKRVEFNFVGSHARLSNRSPERTREG